MCSLNKITYKLTDLKIKIVNIEKICAEYGRTYDYYLCFTCDDGSRVILYGGEPYNPNPSLEEMRKVDFFTPEEIGEKLEQIEREKRHRKQQELEDKKRQLQKLKKELGEI